MHRDMLALSSSQLGDVALKLGRPAEALDGYGRAFALLEQLINENPTDDELPQPPGPQLAPGAGWPAGLWATPPARRPTSGRH